MRTERRPYSGRLIFDHLPKTAGQAINAWLRDVLGDGTVTTNVVGTHRELLRLSGEYPIVSGHVLFGDGDGLDPRFRYATLLREPVERTLSWLYFVTRNHEAAALPELHALCMAYLESEGEECPPALRPHLFNPTVGHFAAILGSRDQDSSELVETAFRAIVDYDCVGIYEKLNGFVKDLAALIGIPSPPALQAVNITKLRPRADEVSVKLRNNIERITELDRSLYSRVVALVEGRSRTGPSEPPTQSAWARYDRPHPTPRVTSALTLHSVRSFHREPTFSGAVLHFELEFELHAPVRLLEAGFHILDDRQRWAFGANNVLLDQPFVDLRPGRYCLGHFVTAELAAGDYTIGFAFADVGRDSEQSLYWHDGILPLHIRRSPHSMGVGSADCSARMMLVQRGGQHPAHDPQLASNSNDTDIAA